MGHWFLGDESWSGDAGLIANQFFSVSENENGVLLRLQSEDGTNRLTSECVRRLIDVLEELSAAARPLVITGNDKFFSAGADLQEIAALTGPAAYDFAKMGQQLTHSLEELPVPVFAAVAGYCMGGGLDLALACHRRIAAQSAVFGHRGAALGLITGWGGTQRLPRLIGKSMALQMFVAAEKIGAWRALEIGLIQAVVADPVEEGFRQIGRKVAL
jgi:enoyl-CoA hydratase/carnithine racemase